MINYTSAYAGDINPFRYRSYYYDTETGFYYLNARYYDPQIKRFISPDTFDNLGANGDLNSYNLYAYCSNNPVMYVDPTGEFIWFLAAVVALVVVDTIVETAILMNSEEYKAENVIDESGNVEIPNSAYFNNPIAQCIYSDYLYDNVKNENGENFFTGDVYDIVGEWQMQNAAFWAPISLASQGNIGIGIVGAKLTHESSISVSFDSNLVAEKNRGQIRKYGVYYPSKALSYFNRILTFNFLNWGD